jgi:hypothetical protein
MAIQTGQTGPMTNQPMDAWLDSTGRLELFNAALFAFLVWWGGRSVGYLSMLGLLTLDALLVQGGLYWLLKRRQLRRRRGNPFTTRVLRTIYAVNILLLLAFPLGVLVAASGIGPPVRCRDLVLGTALYALGVGEFVHYFLYKINMRPRELRRAWREKRTVPSRLRREMARAAQRESVGRGNN